MEDENKITIVKLRRMDRWKNIELNENDNSCGWLLIFSEYWEQFWIWVLVLWMVIIMHNIIYT